MKWSLKFPTKGKKDVPDGSKSLGTGVDSFRSAGAGGVERGGAGSNGGGLRSNLDGDGDVEVGDSGTPSVTPPDANGGVPPGGEKDGRDEMGQQPSTEAMGMTSAPPFTVDSTGNGGRSAGEAGGPVEDGDDPEGENEEDDDIDGEGDDRSDVVADGGDDHQDDVFDDESHEDADSLHASKTARIKSFADDPEGHTLEDMDADWEAKDNFEGGEGEERPGLYSPRVSRGDDRSGTGGAGSHSYHSGGRSADATGTEEFNSNASPDHQGGKANTYASFGGMSLGQSEPLEGEQSQRQDDADKEEQEEDMEDEPGGVHQRRGQRMPRNEKMPGEHDDEEEDDEEEHVEVEGDGIGVTYTNRVDADVGNNGRGVEHHYQRGGRSGVVGLSSGAASAGAGNGIGGPSNMGGNSVGAAMRNRSRDLVDADNRVSHAYADDLDENIYRDSSGYTGGRYQGAGVGGGDRQIRQSHGGLIQQGAGGSGMGSNGLTAVDSRTQASLARGTRLASGGNAGPGGVVVVGPKAEASAAASASAAAAVAVAAMGPGQAAVAAAQALRRGPTPGSHSLPSMVLVPLEALKAHRRVPRSSDRRALVRYRDLPDRSRSFVVFVSHSWMRPHTTPSFAHPDTSSRGGEKYRLISEAGDRIRAHLPPDVRVLLWIDYSCVDQDSTRRSRATMRGMREYMRRCDAILTVYPGEAADNGEEFLPNRFVKSCSWAGSYKSLAHYCTRGWCRLEMLLGQTEPLPQDGFMFNFLVPKKKKASGAKSSIGDRPHFLYGAHQRPHNGRIDVVPRQSSRWFEEHHPEQGNFTHESDRDAIRAVLAKQTSTMAKKSAAMAARFGTDPRRGHASRFLPPSDAPGSATQGSAPGSGPGPRMSPSPEHTGQQFSDEYGRPH